jgi:thiol-disulfide isomerase/thioredoxin
MVRLITAVVVAGSMMLVGCGEQERSSVGTDDASLQALRRADPDASRLIPGGRAELERRLRATRGRPVVVNQWASWCGPCRAEFPLFQRVAVRLRGEVAFLGVNSKDSEDDAAAFLRRFPTPYAHVVDPDARAARAIGGGRAWPTTAFYDARGRRAFTHQGQYAKEADLLRDIERYAR